MGPATLRQEFWRQLGAIEPGVSYPSPGGTWPPSGAPTPQDGTLPPSPAPTFPDGA